MTDESNSFIGILETQLIAAISAQRAGRDPENIASAKRICISCHISAMLFDGEEVAEDASKVSTSAEIGQMIVLSMLDPLAKQCKQCYPLHWDNWVSFVCPSILCPILFS